MHGCSFKYLLPSEKLRKRSYSTCEYHEIEGESVADIEWHDRQGIFPLGNRSKEQFREGSTGFGLTLTNYVVKKNTNKKECCSTRWKGTVLQSATPQGEYSTWILRNKLADGMEYETCSFEFHWKGFAYMDLIV